ncbi:MAG: HdeD family acid-resistance protein [Streptosporangiaceae bacterium]|jgi:uncharacterized membrane protein HdeD (DUF308 family)
MTAARGAASAQPAGGQAGQQESGPPGQQSAGPQTAAGGRDAGGQPNYAVPGLPGKHGWLVMLGAAVAFFAVGLILLVWPKATLTIVAILIGIALIVTGLVRLFDGFTAREESGGRRVADVVVGALAVIVGLYCLKHHALSIALVAFIVGVFWVLHGIADLAVAATSRGAPGRGLRAIGGLFSLIAGLLVLFWPGITVLLLVIILGIWLIFYAAVLAVLAFQLRPGRTRSAAQHVTT